MKGTKSCVKSNGDERRDRIERRAYQYTFYIPERRNQRDRRKDQRT